MSALQLAIRFSAWPLRSGSFGGNCSIWNCKTLTSKTTGSCQRPNIFSPVRETVALADRAQQRSRPSWYDQQHPQMWPCHSRHRWRRSDPRTNRCRLSLDMPAHHGKPDTTKHGTAESAWRDRSMTEGVGTLGDGRATETTRHSSSLKRRTRRQRGARGIRKRERCPRAMPSILVLTMAVMRPPARRAVIRSRCRAGMAITCRAQNQRRRPDGRLVARIPPKRLCRPIGPKRAF